MAHPTLRLKRVHLAQRRAIERAVAPLGLTAAQFDVVQMLLHEDGQEHGALQERLNVASPTLSRLLDGMEREGHVERRGDPADGRVRRVHLGPAAHRLVASPAFAQAGEALVARMLGGFSAEERAAFLAMLDRVEANLRDP